MFPRYTLRFVERHENDKHEDSKYHILAYGEYTPITLEASEVLNNRRIKELLDPDELLEFHFRHLEQQEKDNTYHIKDISHDGIIILKNKFQTFTFTHEEFCNKPWIMEKTAPLDIYRIVSETYFNCGRNLEKQLSSKRADSGVVLKIVKSQNNG